MPKYVFGPVPSRRFGKSLGINNIPQKHCTYSCVYCQVGKTLYFEYKRRIYYDPEKIIEEAVEIIEKNKKIIDYVTFVPDGEPTLDAKLGYEAKQIKEETGAKLAIITNSSLIYEEDVRSDLMLFDAVSLKVDAITKDIWIKVNRPHHKINLDKILENIIDFSKDYKGILYTETMLVRNLNDTDDEFLRIASFLKKVKLDKAFIGIPIRPPAEKWVKPPSEEKILSAYNIFRNYLGIDHIELLINYESGDFYRVDDAVNSLLSIVSVHPMRIDYVYKFLRDSNLDYEVLDKLIAKGVLLKINYSDHTFIVRKFPGIRSKET